METELQKTVDKIVIIFAILFIIYFLPELWRSGNIFFQAVAVIAPIGIVLLSVPILWNYWIERKEQ